MTPARASGQSSMPASIGIGHLPGGAVVGEALLRPGLHDELDVVLEDAAVMRIVVAVLLKLRLLREAGLHGLRVVDRGVGRLGRARAEMLAVGVGPARLIAAGEAHEGAALREMVDDRDLLGHADRVVRAHHVAEGADMDVLRLGQPVGVGGAGRGRDLVAFRPEMMLGRGGAPEAHLVRRLDDLGHAVDGVLVALAVPPDGAQRGAFLLVAGGDDGVHDHDRLEHGGLRPWVARFDTKR